MKSFGQKPLTQDFNRNDPGRFFGDGVTFKAKLIGILEVGEARGDRMCQEALQDLKMAIRAAGEHKQRITIHVTIDGLRLRDEKTGDSLYHHPVHKISFIAQDMTDSRAFGYIFGSPDSGHRFFGIKTDKAASQVVLAMRDLFQVVFELKKKEIEMARQQIQSKTIHEHQPISLNVKSTQVTETTNTSFNKNAIETSKSNAKEMSPESVADLVDLEQELSSIQRGITQMERITPSEPTAGSKGLSEEDPFGDSFTNFPQYNLLPPPEQSRSRHSKPMKPPDNTIPDVPIQAHNTTQPTTNNIPVVTNNSTKSNNSNNNNNNNNQNMKNLSTKERWLENTEDVATFEGSQTKSMDSSSTTSTTHHPSVTSQTSHDDNQIQITGEEFSKNHVATTTVAPSTTTTQTQYIDAFTDLDPLGTGKSKPYIDKKYFFQDLKNPPKKVLKDLSGQDGTFAATFSGNETTTSNGNSKTAEVFERASESFDSVTGLDNKSAVDFIPKVLPQTNIERAKMEEPVMMPRDTDPFSPTRKKSDPFQDGDIFSKLDPFDFDFSNKNNNITTQDTTTSQLKTVNGDGNGLKLKKDGGNNMFNGPLQVTLPPESWTTSMAQKKIERQTSESPTSIPRNRPSVFKQNTVDVISSISSKKMPHLFGQKFSKRDSNSINMRRLQESDSLSENETAPEPPPRPESISHVEPPPLPPKKQFSDIIIRPRITSSSAIPPPIRYDYVTSKMKNTQGIIIDSAAPPIPLPSRKIGRSDTNFPGPGRPGRKPGGEEDDYLTPITSRNDVPPLLPPPQTKSGRHRRLEHVVEHKTEPEVQPVKCEIPPESIIPDITLSQLLTLGIDELATKLNVPTTKLSTMTLVELTRYLSDFIESSKKVTPPPTTTTTAKVKSSTCETAVFKVNFDQHSDATFIAKFDDNFGEEQPTQATFVANFSDFDEKPQTTSSSTTVTKTSTVPPADRYAVFREIIEQEMQNETASNEDGIDDNSNDADDSGEKNESDTNVSNEILNDQISPIDTKITEVISHAKDRYAALRDIILVEDLFDKPIQQQPENTSMETIEGGSDEKDDDQDVFTDAETDKLPNEESSPEINNDDNFVDTIETEISGETRQTPEIRQNGTLIQNLTMSSNKDDLEIDEFMNRAISNLSLDSREHLSPIATTKSPTSSCQNNNTTPPNAQIQQIKTSVSPIVKSQFNDMSTSPIPLQKSPAQKSPASKSPISKSPLSKSPIPQSPAVTNLIDASKRTNSGSLSDVVCESSPEADNNIVVEQSSTKQILTPSNATTESWAIFDQPTTEKKSRSSQNIKSPKVPSKELAESPCSSDGKDEWKADQEYGKRWPKGQTSSSSRDLSPWDDEGSDYKKRPPPSGADRHGYYMRHARRMNSCDDDYDYEEECMKRRERRLKAPTSRSRENFDSDSQNWYHHSNHHNWSPPEEDEARPRPFERAVYERNTYGPPFEKRDHKLAPHMSYDRRDYKNYDKRKYYRDYSRPEYEFESYGESPDTKDRKFTYYPENFEKPKCRRDYENIYEDEFSRDVRGQKSREYAYDRDRKSFDRDSVESYESTGRRHKSFGSGDVYGSLDSRSEFRERYMTSEKSRSLRKGMKLRSTEEYEHDSENDVQMRRPQNETRSLQRPPQGTRIRKSSGSSPWDGEEIPPIPGQKNWKRPSSASESDRRLTENRRVLCHTLSGSDGEKERRFRKKPRPKGKEVEGSNRQQSFGTMRYSTHRDVNYDYIDYEEYEQPPIDEDKFERLNRRRQDMHQRMMEADRRKKSDKYNYEEDENVTATKYTPKKESFYPEKERYMSHKFEDYEEPKSSKSLRREFDFDDFEDTPRSNASSSKFNFDDHGFESDFNSPPPPPPPTLSTSASTKASFRFSNDFTEKEKQTIIQGNYEQDYNQTPSQKLRFDDKVTISKFESDSHHGGAFEDDFSKAEFVFEDNEDQWNPEIPPKKNSLRLTKRQENIKKSESVNIFAKKVDDPFEDDDFFKTTTPNSKDDNSQLKKSHGGDDAFQWDSNFAKFDENM